MLLNSFTIDILNVRLSERYNLYKISEKPKAYYGGGAVIRCFRNCLEICFGIDKQGTLLLLQNKTYIVLSMLLTSDDLNSKNGVGG